MERNTREQSRERINDGYLRQMLREEARYGQRRSSCGSGGCAYTPTFSGNGDRPAEKERPLAMVYAEKQSFKELYGAKEALRRGTLFKQLDFPLGI